MPTEADAKKANEYVRKVLKHGSDNKVNEAWNDKRMQEYFEATKKMKEYLDTKFADEEKDPIQHFLDVAKWVEKNRAGNCKQYACLAFSFLKDAGVFPMDMIGVTRSKGFRLAGHHFIVLGRPANAPLSVDGLKGLKEADDIFIVDGWVNYAGPVKKYQAAWKKKISDWIEKGKINETNPFNKQAPITFEELWPELLDSAENYFVLNGRLEANTK